MIEEIVHDNIDAGPSKTFLDNSKLISINQYPPPPEVLNTKVNAPSSSAQDVNMASDLVPIFNNFD